MSEQPFFQLLVDGMASFKQCDLALLIDALLDHFRRGQNFSNHPSMLDAPFQQTQFGYFIPGIDKKK